MTPGMRIRSGFMIVLTAALLMMLALAPNAFAARNPSSTGQPNYECPEDGSQSTPGFMTDGFAHAETVYAGNGKSADHAHSDHAVSQYDVACYQQASNGH